MRRGIGVCILNRLSNKRVRDERKTAGLRPTVEARRLPERSAACRVCGLKLAVAKKGPLPAICKACKRRQASEQRMVGYHKKERKQKGRFAICGKVPELPDKLNVDHDHDGKFVRALLCGSSQSDGGAGPRTPPRYLRGALSAEVREAPKLTGDQFSSTADLVRPGARSAESPQKVRRKPARCRRRPLGVTNEIPGQRAYPPTTTNCRSRLRRSASTCRGNIHPVQRAD